MSHRAKDWNLSPADAAELYLRAAEACKACKQLYVPTSELILSCATYLTSSLTINSDERHKFLVNYLRAVEQSDAKSLEKAKEHAVDG